MSVRLKRNRVFRKPLQDVTQIEASFIAQRVEIFSYAAYREQLATWARGWMERRRFVVN